MFFLILENIVSCLLISFIVTAILIIVCGRLPRWISSHFRYNLLHYSVLLLTAVLLFVQVFLFIGAGYVKSYISKAENGIISVKELEEEYPLIREYSDAYINADNVQNEVHNVLEPIHQHFDLYMWKRIIWATTTLILLIAFLVYQAKRQGVKFTSYKGRRSQGRRNYDF